MSSIGVLISHDLGRDDNIRGKDSFLARLERRLTKTLNQPGQGVRGNIVAMDTLLEALITHSGLENHTLYASSAFTGNIRQRVSLKWKLPPEAVTIKSSDSLLDGTDQSLDCLLSLELGKGDAYRYRDVYAPRVFPIMSLTHGLSLDFMLYSAYLRILLAKTYSCDSIICTSRASQTAMTNILAHVESEFNSTFNTELKYEGRIDRLPLCINTDQLRPLDKRASRRKMGLPRDGFILLYLGRISPLKADLFPMLPALRVLVDKYPTRHLTLVVAGTLEEALPVAFEEAIARSGLTKNVRRIYDISDADKATLFSAADVFVAPSDSLQESFGLAPIEAMSCGVPQIVADWDGYRDTVVEGETGFLLPTAWTQCDRDLRDTGALIGFDLDHYALGQSASLDFGKFIQAVEALLDNPELRDRMAENSRKRAVGSFSQQVVAAQYGELSRHLQMLAKSEQKQSRSHSFESPNYFKFFNGYASTLLTDDTVFQRTGFDATTYGQWFLATLDPAKRPIDALEIISDEIVASLLSEFGYSSGSEQQSANIRPSRCFGHLVKFATDRFPINNSKARRQVMWLLKHGYISLSDNNPT